VATGSRASGGRRWAAADVVDVDLGFRAVDSFIAWVWIGRYDVLLTGISSCCGKLRRYAYPGVDETWKVS
jgi:hypothetical protein